jgi:hypothetical protein
MTPEEIRDQLASENEEALLADGYEPCLIGITYQYGRPPVACYDHDKCIELLMKRDGMSHEEAVEFFEFNTLGAGMGENSPVFTKLFT